jgi:hypothetical protein
MIWAERNREGPDSVKVCMFKVGFSRFPKTREDIMAIALYGCGMPGLVQCVFHAIRLGCVKRINLI